MATVARDNPQSDIAILARLIRPEEGLLTPDAAQAILRIGFDQSDLDRMHDLVVRNQSDDLTLVEKIELENYRRVSFLLDLMHSKARKSLKTP
jgi:hypothetical protein